MNNCICAERGFDEVKDAEIIRKIMEQSARAVGTYGFVRLQERFWPMPPSYYIGCGSQILTTPIPDLCVYIHTGRAQDRFMLAV